MNTIIGVRTPDFHIHYKKMKTFNKKVEKN